jgi:hypothetical protein
MGRVKPGTSATGIVFDRWRNVHGMVHYLTTPLAEDEYVNAACTVFDGKFVEFQASRSTCLLNVQNVHNFNQTLLANVDMIFHSMSTQREPKILSNSPNVAVNFKSSCTSQPVRDPYCGRRPETIYHCFNL